MNQPFHLRSGYARRQSFPIGISATHRCAHLAPIVSQKSGAHAERGIANTIEEFKEFRVTIDVTFKNFPVIGARKARLAGVANCNPVFEFRFIDTQRFTFNTVGTEMEAGGGPILRRIIILETSGHSNHSGLDIRSDADEFPLVVAIPDQTIESADAGNGERR